MIKQRKTGQLIIVSAPSGSGKDTVVKKLMENKYEFVKYDPKKIKEEKSRD